MEAGGAGWSGPSQRVMASTFPLVSSRLDPCSGGKLPALVDGDRSVRDPQGRRDAGAPSPRGGCSGPRRVGQAARAMANLSGATANAPPFAPSVREQRRGHQLVWREEEEPLADALRPGPGRRATLPSAASSHSGRSPCGPAVQGLRPPRAPARE